MKASLVSSWKSQRYLDFKCPKCMVFIRRPGILPEFLFRDWYHPSILFYRTGDMASFSASALCPGHYQVMAIVPSKCLRIFSVPSPCYPQVQTIPCLHLYYCKQLLSGFHSSALNHEPPFSTLQSEQC